MPDLTLSLPAVGMGALGMYMLMLLTVWLYGMRYTDLTWLFLAALALLVRLYIDERNADPALLIFTHLAMVATALSQILPSVRGRTISIAVVGMVVSAQYVLILDHRTQHLLFSALYGITTVVALPFYRESPQKRRKYLNLVAIVLIVGLLAELAASFSVTALTSVHFLAIDFFIFVCLAIVTIIDLIIFGRPLPGYQPIAALDVQHSLSLAVKKSVITHDLTGSFGGFHYDLILVQQVKIHTVWHFIWQTQQETRLMFGEVQSKSALTPIALAAIIFQCHASKDKQEDIPTALKSIDHMLYSLFAGDITTTATIYSLGHDGTFESWNAGGSGVIIHDKTNTTQVKPPSHELGIPGYFEVSHDTVPLFSDELLIGGSSGMLGNNKQQDKMISNLEAGSFHDQQGVKSDIIAQTNKFGRKQDGIIVFISRNNE